MLRRNTQETTANPAFELIPPTIPAPLFTDGFGWILADAKGMASCFDDPYITACPRCMRVRQSAHCYTSHL